MLGFEGCQLETLKADAKMQDDFICISKMVVVYVLDDRLCKDSNMDSRDILSTLTDLFICQNDYVLLMDSHTFLLLVITVYLIN